MEQNGHCLAKSLGFVLLAIVLSLIWKISLTSYEGSIDFSFQIKDSLS